jgi:hypothetical protein
MALLGAARARATERPIFTGWSKVSDRSCKTQHTVDDGSKDSETSNIYSSKMQL